MMVVRCLCICLLNPIFRLAGSHMSLGEVVFATVGGLRGAISLVLAQVLVTQANPNPEQKDQQRVTAQVRPQSPRPLDSMDQQPSVLVHPRKAHTAAAKSLRPPNSGTEASR